MRAVVANAIRFGCLAVLFTVSPGCARDGLVSLDQGDLAAATTDMSRPSPDLLRQCVIPDSDHPLFGPALTAAAPNAMYNITTADFDGDSRLDVLAGGNDHAAAVLLLNRGGGVLGPATVFADDARMPYIWHYVAAGDVNSDDRVDFAVTGGNFGQKTVVVYRNLGGGHFAAPVIYPGNSFAGPNGLALTDLDGDGRLDIASSDDGHALQLLNRGDGTFDPPIKWPLSGGGWQPQMVMSDLDRDGRPDYVITGSQNGEVDVALGERRGIYQRTAVFPAGPTPRDLASADLDGDGAPDVVVGNMDDKIGGISILYNRGDGVLLDPVHHEAGLTTLGVAAGDVDGDGRVDIVAGRRPISVFLNRGGRAFDRSWQFSGAIALTLADMNSDGKLDIVAVTEGGISVFLNQGSGCH